MDEVLECFKIFYKMVEMLFEKKVKVYTNMAMQIFLRDNDIVHQTIYVSTPDQNDVAERKIRHSRGDEISHICHECPKLSWEKQHILLHI
jgi:hypothetical protein